MKTFKNLYERVCSFENLYRAFRGAAKGKSLRLDCAGFAYDREREILKLQAELLDETYRHGPYREFTVRDPKVREVKAARFRDRVVHHALCNVIEPIFEARFISGSFACRKGNVKGSPGFVPPPGLYLSRKIHPPLRRAPAEIAGEFSGL